MPTVKVERTDDGGFVARNDRGAEVAIGGADGDGVFSPVELLLAALGGCELVTVEPLTARRGHRLASLAATVHAEKIEPTRLGTVTIIYPPSTARAVTDLPDHDQVVTRTTT
jgi:putative redox protein